MKLGNPNHPVSRATEDQWHKIAALLVLKMGTDRVVITSEDINRAFKREGGVNITVRFTETGIILAIVGDAEAERLAREQGGLPV